MLLRCYFACGRGLVFLGCSSHSILLRSTLLVGTLLRRDLLGRKPARLCVKIQPQVVVPILENLPSQLVYFLLPSIPVCYGARLPAVDEVLFGFLHQESLDACIGLWSWYFLQRSFGYGMVPLFWAYAIVNDQSMQIRGKAETYRRAPCPFRL